ncbi:CAP-associated domain-containing protein [Macrococcus brunensis]|uniref:CAP domain-containing protein n=1 Tax=Macrococcus brunensis TaxID=198483 RepID=UPI001EF0ABCC|nr:CAP-associated domain-containing protein [Macrococcus brunensis]ULG73251.1 CAP domain-containing protein [Macrococcus brunensis]
MKKLLLFCILAAVLFLVPVNFSTLPDHATLSVKESLRHLTAQERPEKTKAVSVGRIKMNMSKSQVNHILGKEKRVLRNPYGSWTLYHQQYQHFVMVGFMNNRVAALYSNDPQYIDSQGVLTAKSLEQVKKLKGTPLSVEAGSNYRVRLSDKHVLRYRAEGIRSTYYFDQFNRRVDALMIMSDSYFNQKQQFYGHPSVQLARSYEQLDFELINASRVKRGLSALQFNDKISHTARQHSIDMAENHFFSHVNQQGQTPFDRMKQDGLHFSTAGENIAYGQVSSIEAHHGLMNSKGHRQNILNRHYLEVGTGVAFNEKNAPYYTENFITEN